jgi:hypothetical protein
MAESIGLMIVSVPANGKCPAMWHVAQRQDGIVRRLWVSYDSPKDLLDEFLGYYRAFNLYGRVTNNPFYGMSPAEVELRLAVLGE